MKTALITGITGQDGSYLAELLIDKGYMVHGIVRRASLINTHRIDHIFDHPQMKLHYPRSPYGVAKLYAYWITKNYRESYGMYACTGILFNHESPRRGETFVTRKITRGLSKISCGLQDVLYLGNLSGKRDWGHAKDYAEAMWLMLQQDSPEDYVIATGHQYSVKEFVEKSADYFGMDIEWQGEGLEEIGIDKSTGRVVIRVDDKYFRPAEVESLLGDATKAKEQLGWEPKISFNELVEDMCIYGQ